MMKRKMNNNQFLYEAFIPLTIMELSEIFIEIFP